MIIDVLEMSPAAGKPARLYTFVIRYDKSNGEESRVLTFTMFGPLRDWRVWTALRWAASAVISVSREWRGVLWEGWPVCAEGHAERTYLATPDKVCRSIISHVRGRYLVVRGRNDRNFIGAEQQEEYKSI